MSVSHNFYINSELIEFSAELLDKVKEIIKKYSSLITDSNIDKEHIFITFPVDRPSTFYITTKKEDCYLPIKDKALFTFSKYYDGKYNAVFCEIALLCKYYLGEKLTISSDGFYYGIDSDWIKAENILQNENIDIKLKWREEDVSVDTFINGEYVLNEFDRDGAIFNSMYTVVINPKRH